MSEGLSEYMVSDAELIRRVVDRDHEAFCWSMTVTPGGRLALSGRVLNDPHDAEDVLQQVMQELWTRHAARYDAVLGRVDAWIYRLLRLRAIDRVRANERRN